MDISKNKRLEYYGFYKIMDEIQNDKIKHITFSCNSYLRRLIYIFCKNNNLSVHKHHGKINQFVCLTHKCICKGYWNNDPLYNGYFIKCPNEFVEIEIIIPRSCDIKQFKPKCILITVCNNKYNIDYGTDYRVLWRQKVLKMNDYESSIYY